MSFVFCARLYYRKKSKNTNLPNYSIEHTPTEAATGCALLNINKKNSDKISTALTIYEVKKL